MDKNIAIPDDLLTAITEMAQAEGKTPDELVEFAARQYIAREQIDRLVRRNEKRARDLGIKEEEIPKLVEQWRRERRTR